MNPTETRFREIVARLTYKDWRFAICRDPLSSDFTPRYYLQIQVNNGTCNVTKQPCKWHGRKWPLSQFMTDSEIVGTAFLAVRTAEEHETREMFLYRGAAIYQGHLDVEALVEINRQGKISVRPGEAR